MSGVKEFVQERLEQMAEERGLLEGEKMQLNVRLPTYTMFYLDEVAKTLELNRPTAAATLLTIAIEEAAETLNLTLESEEFRERYANFSGSAKK